MKFKVEAGEKKEINIEYNCVSKLMSGSDENPWTRVHFTVYLINIDEVGKYFLIFLIQLKITLFKFHK